MVLISVVSNYQFLEAILLKMTILKNKKCVLMLGEPLRNKYPNYVTLEKLFEKILFFEIGVRVKGNELINKKDYFKELFSKNGLDLNNFEEIYVAAAHLSFGIYLVQSKLNFIFMEDGAGVLSHPEVLYNLEYNSSVKKAEIIKKLGLYDGTAKNIIKILCNMDSQTKLVNNNMHYIDFNIALELKKINDNSKEITYILKAFNIGKYDIDKNTVVVFTEHFANLSILSFEYQIIAYELFVDYFLNNQNIIFKPHPDDLLYYSKLFPDTKIIKEKFPSELIPYIFNNKPNMLATISSSSVNNLSNYVDKIISLGFEARDVNFINSYCIYYLALYIIKKLQFNNIFYSGCYASLINNLIEYTDIKTIDSKIDNYNVLVMDNEKKYELETIKYHFDNEIPIVIFSNFLLYEKEFREYIIPVNISIDCNNKYYQKKNIRNRLYFISKNKNIRNIIMEMEFKKELKMSDITLHIKKMDEKDIKIKTLEGILEATEKRLLNELEVNKKLTSLLEERGIKYE